MAARGTGAVPAVRFGRLFHLITVPVRLASGAEVPFVLDTGIGVNLLGPHVAAAAGLVASEASYVGRRMSGQEVRLPLGTVPSLELGGRRWTDVTVGGLDFARFPPELASVGGFLSLDLFRELPFTLAFSSGELEFGLPDREAVRVPLEVQTDGPSTSAFVDLGLPGGARARAELDTGSEATILDLRYLEGLGRSVGDPRLSVREGTDETGYRYTRYGGRIDGDLAFAGRPDLAAPLGEVIFQAIVHEALVGTAFLGSFDLGFDLPARALAVQRRATG